MLDAGRGIVYPVAEALGRALKSHRLILGTGGGARTRHVFSIGLDLGLPTGVLAQLAAADALGNAHILGTLLAPHGVVAIPPELFGHLLPLFVHAVPGVIFNGVPPYSLWEHPPKIGRIPPHRTDAGCFLLAECFGLQVADSFERCRRALHRRPEARPLRQIHSRDHRGRTGARNIASLPFDRVLIQLLGTARLLTQFQIVNAHRPELIERALNGEHVGTIVRR